MRLPSACVTALLLGSCAIPNAVDCMQSQCPPPELGRSAWVRVCAGTGGWIGAVLGGVVSVVLLPIDYPLALLCDDGFDENGREDFLWWPALSGAAIGHAVLGGPTDALDWVFYRAWVDEPAPAMGYEFVPMPDAELPRAGDAAKK